MTLSCANVDYMLGLVSIILYFQLFLNHIKTANSETHISHLNYSMLTSKYIIFLVFMVQPNLVNS